MAQLADRTVGIVVVQYYLTDSALRRRIAALIGYFRKGGYEIVSSIVDIRFGGAENQTQKNHEATTSTARFLDVSAYGIGLKKIPECDVTVVLNDTLFTRHPWKQVCRNLLQVLNLLISAPGLAAGGVVHRTTQLVLLDVENPSRQHLSTFFVAMNRAARSCFESLIDALPDGDESSVLDWIAAQQDRYMALGTLLHAHMIDESNPWSWAGLRRAPSESLRSRKAVTVIFEYIFSSEVLRRGGCLVPLNRGVSYRLTEYCMYAKKTIMQSVD